VRGRGALRLLRSSRFALTQPDRFATGASTRPRFICLGASAFLTHAF